MPLRLARPVPVAAAVAALSVALAPRGAFAQACSTADAAAGLCLIQPTAAQATPTASGYAAGTPVTVSAKSVGGLAYFSASLYAFASAPDPTNPLATQNVLLGSKATGGSLSDSDPWVALPWTIVGSDQLFFGLLVNVLWDFNKPNEISPTWLFSGYGASAYTRTDQLGRTSPAFSDVFGAVGPVGDQIDPNDAQSTRFPTPSVWMASNLTPPTSVAGQTYFVGFEDSILNSDGDFNDFVLAVNVSSVPEPATFALVGGGLVLMGAVARRRRRR